MIIEPVFWPINEPPERQSCWGFATYGLMSKSISQLTSIYDLLHIQVSSSVLRGLVKKYSDADPIGEYIREVQFIAELRLVELIPEVIDLGSLPFSLRRTFLEESIDKYKSIEGHRELANFSEWEGEVEYYENVLRKQERSLNQIKQSARVSGYIYLLRSVTGYWKIGRTVNPADRIKTFSVKLPFEVEYEHLIPCTDHVGAESELHRRFATKRANGEWFCLDAADVAWIKAIKYL